MSCIFCQISHPLPQSVGVSVCTALTSQHIFQPLSRACSINAWQVCCAETCKSCCLHHKPHNWSSVRTLEASELLAVFNHFVLATQVAATEKAAAGEGRNVEHVAEADDLTHAAVKTKRTNQSRKSKHKAAGSEDPEVSNSQPKRQRRTKAGVV